MGWLLRIALVLALIASAVFYALQIALVPQSGYLGFLTNETWSNAPSVTRHVGSVILNSPAWKAGIRAGDTLPLANVDRASRIALVYALPGDAVRYNVERDGTSFEARFAAEHRPPYRLSVADAIRMVVNLSLWIFGLLVVLRAWNTEYGPLIASILTVLVLDASADRVPWSAPIANPLGAALFGTNGAIDGVTSALTIVLTLFLAGRLTQWRSNWFRITAACGGVLALFILIYFPFGLYAMHTGTAGAFTEFFVNWPVNNGEFYVLTIGLLVAYLTAPSESRQRLLWIVWGFCPYLFGVGLLNAALALYPALISGTQFGEIAGGAFRSLELALPAALFYGVLVRRSVDVGFVVNRVAVYGALSIVLVSLFIVLEYAFSKVFLDSNRAGSLAIQLAIALAIGFSARYLHKVVDRFVDRVLFAKRHADESALRRFAQEAESYSSPRTLLDRAIQVLHERSEARGAAIYLSDNGVARAVRTSGNGFPESVDADDELLVKLRRWNEPVDTHDAKTVFPDGMVFPMHARGKFVGALACETKRDYSAFDPDERESLFEVGHSLASALDALSANAADSIASLRESIAAAVASLSEKIDSLPTRLKGRLDNDA